MSGAIMNYDFSTKRHWRRWIWNRIEERVARPKEGLCLYLPGERDFDRPVALSKGFKAINMIGVERDKKTLQSLRDNGVLTVNADFIKTVDTAVISGKKIDVIFGDFCGGLHANFYVRLIYWLGMYDVTQNCVFAFNLLGANGTTKKLCLLR